MSNVCLREVDHAHVSASNEKKDVSSHIRVDGPLKREISNEHEDTARVFSEFIQALRSSRVSSLFLNKFVFPPEVVALVLQTTIVTDDLCIVESSCAQLTPVQFREVLLHFSPSSLHLGMCRLLASQISDELVRALFKKHVRYASFVGTDPVDGGRFCVTDTAIVDFCMQPDDPVGPGEDAVARKLEIYRGSFTNGLFKRLIEASSVSTRTQPLRIAVSRSHVEEEDLRDFAQYLSYGNDLVYGRLRIYDFPDKQRGTVAPMHLQIVLSRGGRLELIRAQRPHDAFYKPDE